MSYLSWDAANSEWYNRLSTRTDPSRIGWPRHVRDEKLAESTMKLMIYDGTNELIAATVSYRVQIPKLVRLHRTLTSMHRHGHPYRPCSITNASSEIE